MNFKFDLKEKARVYGDKSLTFVFVTVAFIYVMGKKTGSYYFNNQEVIHEDLRIFFNAVVAGTKNAYRATYQLGSDFRVFYNDNYPTIRETVTNLDRKVMDGYGYTVACLQDLFKF